MPTPEHNLPHSNQRPTETEVRFIIFLCTVMLSSVAFSLTRSSENESPPSNNTPLNKNSAIISRLQKRLSHPSPILRRKAALQLGQIGAESFPATRELLMAIHDDSLAVQLSAEYALEQIGMAGLPLLVESLDNVDSEIRLSAIARISQLDPNQKMVYRALTKGLDHADLDVSRKSALALANSGAGAKSVSVITILTRALLDGPPEEHEKIAQALLKTNFATSSIVIKLLHQAHNSQAKKMLASISRLDQKLASTISLKLQRLREKKFQETQLSQEMKSEHSPGLNRPATQKNQIRDDPRIQAKYQNLVDFYPVRSIEHTLPHISFMLYSANQTLEKLNDIISLAGPRGEDAWPILDGILETFLKGIDRQKPIRIDTLFGQDLLRFRPHFPVSSINEFRSNVEAFGIKTTQLSSFLFRLTEAFDGFMRFSNEYASFGEKVDDIPMDLVSPAKQLEFLRDHKYDCALFIRNLSGDPEERQRAYRNTLSEEFAWEIPAPVQQHFSEDFLQLTRKYLANRLEDFVAEASTLSIGWLTNITTKEGILEIDLVPNSETELARDIQNVGIQKSEFSNIEQAKNSIFRLRFNRPLNRNSQKFLQGLHKRIREFAKLNFDGNSSKAGSHSFHFIHALDLLFSSFINTKEYSQVDSFIEITLGSEGECTAVAGIVLQDHNTTTQLIEHLVKGFHSGHPKALTSENVSSKIHQIKLPDQMSKPVQKIFNTNLCHLKQTDRILWIAIGKKAAEKLTATTRQARSDQSDHSATPQAEFFNLYIKAGPWYQLLFSKNASERPVSEKSINESAFRSGDDTIELNMKRVENHIEGRMRVGFDLLQFAGIALAQFTNEKLQ